MKQLSLFFATILVILSSCSKDRNTISTNQWDRSYTFQQNKSIDTMTNDATGKLFYYIKQSGDMLLFSYTYSTGYNNNKYDDEYAGTVYFQVDKNATKFSYSGTQMKDMWCFYIGGGAWSGYASTLLDNGSISGSKISANEWSINVDVTLPKKDENTGLQRIQSWGVYKLAQ